MRATVFLLEAISLFLLPHAGGCARNRALVERSSSDAAGPDATSEQSSFPRSGADAVVEPRDGGDACWSLPSVPDTPGCFSRLAEIEVACACFQPRGVQCKWIRIQFDEDGKFVAIQGDWYRADASAQDAEYLRCFEDRLRAQEWQCWAGRTRPYQLDVLACVASGP